MLCKVCLQEKRAEDFYASNRMRCRECVKAAARENRLSRIDYCRQYDRDRGMRPDRVEARVAYMQTNAGKAAHSRACKKWVASNQDKRAAQCRVDAKVKSGRIEQKPCAICGAKAHAHHPDYTRPLDVIWLCPKHHKQAHRAIRDARRAVGLSQETAHF